MGIIEVSMAMWEANRQRTLATLDQIEQMEDPQAVLGWRPAAGRAHAAWQLLHIGITEELFATERLLGTAPAHPDLCPRFKGGSTPDDDIPSVEQIRDVLAGSREHLRNTMSTFSEDDLETIPEPFKQRGWTLGKIIQVISWHECHHQGQTHLTLNLWKVAHA